MQDLIVLLIVLSFVVLVTKIIYSIYKISILDNKNVSNIVNVKNTNIVEDRNKHGISNIHHTFDKYNNKKSKIAASFEK